MSTDGAPIKPVYFTAEDKQTATRLRINDFEKPFPVTPRDGRKPCKTLIVTVPRKYAILLKRRFGYFAGRISVGAREILVGNQSIDSILLPRVSQLVYNYNWRHI